MRRVSHGSALICDDDRLLGIVTERDLLRLLADEYVWHPDYREGWHPIG